MPFLALLVFLLLASGGNRQTIPALPPAALPPVLANGTLGHTNIPAGMFTGLPAEVIWRVDRAYASGGLSLSAASSEVARFPGYSALSQIIELDAKNFASKDQPRNV